MTYTPTELADFMKVTQAIENNLNTKPDTDTEYPFEILEGLVYAMREYVLFGTSVDLSFQMYKLGGFANAQRLSIDAYQLHEDLFEIFNAR